MVGELKQRAGEMPPAVSMQQRAVQPASLPALPATAPFWPKGHTRYRES